MTGLSLSSHGVAHAGGKCVGQVLAEQLLHEVERIEERAVFEDTPVARREKLRGFELHDAAIVALAQTEMQDGCDFCAIDRHEFDFVLSARIPLLLGPDRFGDPTLAVLVPEMRE